MPTASPEVAAPASVTRAKIVLNQCGSSDWIQSTLASEKVTAKTGRKSSALRSNARPCTGSSLSSRRREARTMPRASAIQSAK